MSNSYVHLLDDLEKMGRGDALHARCRSVIRELLTMHQLDQAEIVRLRRQVEALQEMVEGKALVEIRDGNRAAYRMEKEIEADEAWEKVQDRLHKNS